MDKSKTLETLLADWLTSAAEYIRGLQGDEQVIRQQAIEHFSYLDVQGQGKAEKLVDSLIAMAREVGTDDK